MKIKKLIKFLIHLNYQCKFEKIQEFKKVSKIFTKINNTNSFKKNSFQFIKNFIF